VIFHSLTFLLFFAITLVIYWRLSERAQNVMLLIASYVFYGWVHPWWPVLLLATTCIDYWSARRISEAAPGVDARKRWLWVSIVTNFGLLGFYKYFDFFAVNVAAAGEAIGWHIPLVALKLALPAGISFYTFQSMSYTIDVYRGHAAARKSFIDVATFVSFFPHLVAGPIMRATNLLPQVEQRRHFRVDAVRDATVLIVWGLFKKLVIADNVGVIANKVFALQAPEFHVLWAGVFAFAIQIYADFSAYTDIARGVAAWYGFDLIRNFGRPYLATGPADFWHRWNISLSTWFRDYVFIPLGGSRRRPVRVALNVMVTFLASGFWHGASWNYILWGAYHGALLIVTRAAGAVWSPPPALHRWLKPLQIVAMFTLTCVGWLIFRETEWHQLVADFRVSPGASTELGRSTGGYLFLLVLLYSLPLWIHDLWLETKVATTDAPMLRQAPDWSRVAAQTALCGVMFALILTLRSQTALNFIYFAF
jgi:alginate O-acetyltransferase complex protein AlgI